MPHVDQTGRDRGDFVMGHFEMEQGAINNMLEEEVPPETVPGTQDSGSGQLRLSSV